MVYQTGGGNVDSPTGGVKINLVPKEGGNRFSGSLFQGYESKNLQASNGNDFLYSHGVTSLDQIGTYSDTDLTQGGPIRKDRLWFFFSGRLFTVNKPIASTIVSDGTKEARATSCRRTWVAFTRFAAPRCRRATIRPPRRSGGTRRST
jgi:hypothetical protein